MPSAIMTDDTWTKNCLIRPARPDVLRAVPDSADGADEMIEGGATGSEPVDEDGEADSQT